MSDESEKVYKIDGNKVWLSQTAREYARQYFGPGRQGERKMAEYLRMRQNLGDEYVAETDAGESAPEPEGTATSDFLPNVDPSQNIEDRRAEPHYADPTMKKIWGDAPHDVAPQAQVFNSNPLSNALGFRDIGRRSVPNAPGFVGPTAPQWPAAFGQFYQREQFPFHQEGGRVEELTPNQRVWEAFAPDLGESASGAAVAYPSDRAFAAALAPARAIGAGAFTALQRIPRPVIQTKFTERQRRTRTVPRQEEP